MKKIIFGLIGIFSFICGFTQTNTDWGMPYNNEKKAFIIEEVVAADGVSKAELYKRANDWITEYYTSGQKKIYERDPDQNFLKLKNRISVYRQEKKERVNDGLIEYHIDIYFKDGKYKYTFSNFRMVADANSQPIEKWMDGNYYKPEIAKAKYTNLNNLMQESITNMKKFMQTGKKEANSDF
jgi:cytochrome c biogenesis protein ResB